MTDDLPVGLVLDASAILAFTDPQLAIHVGEPLTEAANNGETLALPVACLVEAARASGSALIDVLVGSANVVVLGDRPEAWRALAVTCDIVGSYEAASAALNALDRRVAVLTRRPERYAGVGSGSLTVAIPDA